ncbi:MAG: hypothetical protein ACQESP_11530 [Candidatus Muiribacteriota bacterium]
MNISGNNYNLFNQVSEKMEKNEQLMKNQQKLNDLSLKNKNLEGMSAVNRSTAGKQLADYISSGDNVDIMDVQVDNQKTELKRLIKTIENDINLDVKA